MKRYVPRVIKRDQKGEPLDLSPGEMLWYEEVADSDTGDLKQWMLQMPIISDISPKKQ